MPERSRIHKEVYEHYVSVQSAYEWMAERNRCVGRIAVMLSCATSAFAAGSMIIHPSASIMLAQAGLVAGELHIGHRSFERADANAHEAAETQKCLDTLNYLKDYPGQQG